MIHCEVMIQNKLGLHARAAAKLAEIANQYPCDVHIKAGDMQANGKSILSIMMLAAAQGTTITLIADGEQDEQAIQALTTLIQHRFGEGG